MLRSVLLLLAGLALNAMARVPQECIDSCERLMNGMNKTCNALCDDTAGLMSQECVASLSAWSSNHSLDATAASASSANVAKWSEVLVVTLEQVEKDPSQAEKLIMEVILKGYLKDFGSYAKCKAVESAHYCYTGLGSSNPALDGVPLGMLALCLPQTCSGSDVQAIWDHLPGASALATMFTTKSVCGDQTLGWDAGAVVMVIVCFVIALLVLGATVVAALEPENTEEEGPVPAGTYRSMTGANKSVGWKLLDCFSLFVNVKKFGQIRSGTATSCLDGVRTISMCWVVMGHTLLWPMTSGLPGYSNLGDMAPFYQSDTLLSSFSGQAILSAEFSVDSFFFMSGFLATYIGLKKLGSGKPITPVKLAPFMYLDRFLRLTPCYFFIVLCYTYISPLLASGPFWATLDQDACKDRWWQNLLYIQTIFMSVTNQGENDHCYGVSWYLADDMMFFYLVPFLVALALWKRSSTYLVMGVMGLASIIAGFVLANKNKLSPFPFDPTVGQYMNQYYYPPWTRISPYLIGTAFGVFWRDHQAKLTNTLKDRRLQAAVWVVGFGIIGGCMWGNASAFDNNPSALYTDRARGDMYVGLSKPAWTVGLTLVCMMCFARVGGPVQWFLEAPMFGYLSKLTFTVYLIHPFMLFIWVRAMTYPMYYSPLNYSAAFLAILSSSAALAFLIHLTVEQPTANILAILLAPKEKPQAKDTEMPNSADDQDGFSLSEWMSALPLPFQGESSFMPALCAPPQLLALPPPVYNSSSATEPNQLAVPLAGPDLQDSKSLGGLMIA